MAKGSIMLQIAVEQIFSAPVTDLPEVWTVAWQSLCPASHHLTLWRLGRS
jgi:hypothetical protein